jgi:hypothetical protein
MPRYEVSKVRSAFEILRRAGWLDRAQDELQRKQFTIEVSKENAEALRDLIVAAVKDLAKREPGALEELAIRRPGEMPDFVGSPDCPC